MAAAAGPPADEPAKALLPFLQRADELQKHDPLIAYYCRLYAMDQGLKIPAGQRTKETSELLKSLMGQLEKDKAAVNRSPEDNLYVEGFAQRVFDKADRQDRAGKADISTAKTFYAAGIFFEVASQFGALQPELEQKQKYAVWKAGDIRKALKEGRTPTPGPPGGDDNIKQMFGQPTNSDAAATAGAPSSFGYNPSFAGMPAASPIPSLDAFGLPAAPSLSPSLSGRSTAPAGAAPTAGPAPSTASVPGQWGQTGTVGNGSGVSYDLSSGTSAVPGMGLGQHTPGGMSGYPATGGHGYGAAQYSGQQYPTAYPVGTPSAPPAPHSNPSQPTSSYAVAHPVSSNPSTTPLGGLGGAAPSSSTPAHPFSSSLESSPLPPSTMSSSAAGSHQSSLTLPATSATVASPLVTSAPAPGSGGSAIPPGKVAEAHKAARFAVSALAFDDVPTAIEYLKKSLDLLTKL